MTLAGQRDFSPLGYERVNRRRAKKWLGKT